LYGYSTFISHKCYVIDPYGAEMVGKTGNDPISPCSAPSILSRLAASVDWRSTKISPLYLSPDLSLCLRNKTLPDLLTQEKKSGYKKREEKVHLSLECDFLLLPLCAQRCETFPTKFLRLQLMIIFLVKVNFYPRTRTKLKLKLLICFEISHHNFKHVHYVGLYLVNLRVKFIL
jgi:hypothetical protein